VCNVVTVAIRFVWTGEITNDSSGGDTFSLQWCGSNVVELFPGGSSATFSLDAQVGVLDDV